MNIQKTVKENIVIVVIVMLLTAIIILSTIGFNTMYPHEDVLSKIYAFFQMFVLETSEPYSRHITIVWAQILAAVVVGLSIGEILRFYLRDRIYGFMFKFKKSHIIICGLGEVSKRFLLQTRLHKEYKNKSIAIIEKDKSNTIIEEIEGIKKTTIFYGNALQKSLFERVNINRADTIFINTGNDDTNIDIINTIFSIEPSNCVENKNILIHIDDIHNYFLSKEIISKELVKKRKSTPSSNTCNINIFSIDQVSAQVLYDSEFLPVVNEAFIKKPNKAIAIVGYSKMAEYYILEHMILSQFREKLTLYIVDNQAQSILDSLLYSYPYIQQFITIQAIVLKNNRFDQIEFESLKKECSAWYVFNQHDHTTCTLALNIRRKLFSNNIKDNTPIVACLNEYSSAIDVTREENTHIFNEVYSITIFKQLQQSCTPNLLLHQDQILSTLGCIYHSKYGDTSIYEGFLKCFNTINIEEAIIQFFENNKKNIQLEWNKISESFKDSNRYLVRHAILKQKINTYSQEEKNISEHNRFWAERLLYGWYCFEDNVNLSEELKKELKVKQINYTLIPYDQLPESEKDKDKATFDINENILAALKIIKK